MTDIATRAAAEPRLRLNRRAAAGYLLIVTGLLVLLADGVTRSGQSILGLELVAVGTVLVAAALRRQAERRTV